MNVGPGGIDGGEALPHDLAEPAQIDAVVADVAIPAWVTESLLRAPFVVVRRARGRGGVLPVGVRGGTRHDRFAGWLSSAEVKTRVRPESLARDETWRSTPRAASVPHFSLLDRIGAMVSAHDLVWGPTGSVGYELASGRPAVTPASDIDLVVRAPKKLSRKIAESLLAGFASFPIRIDVQIETPSGAVALAEYASGRSQMAIRTVDGPRLVGDPWAIEICAHEPG